MWNALSSIQKGLDDAAGITTTPPPKITAPQTTASTLLAAQTAAAASQHASGAIDAVPIVSERIRASNIEAGWGADDDSDFLDIVPHSPDRETTRSVKSPRRESEQQLGEEEAAVKSHISSSEVTTVRNFTNVASHEEEGRQEEEEHKNLMPVQLVRTPEALPPTSTPPLPVGLSQDGQLWKGRFDEAKTRWRNEKNLNQQLVSKLSALESQIFEQVNLNTELAATASAMQQQQQSTAGNAEREAALIAEGRELSKNLGLAQERLNEFDVENYQQANLIDKLEKELEGLKDKQRTMHENQKHSTSTEAVMQEQAKMLQERMNALVSENEALKSSNTELIIAVEQQKTIYQNELTAMNERHHFNENQVSSELEQLRELRRREVAEHDHKLLWMQDELSSAHRRAHEAESRGADSQQEISAMTADLRHQLQAADTKMMIFKNSLDAVERENTDLDQELKCKRVLANTLETEKVELRGLLAESRRTITQLTQKTEFLEGEANRSSEKFHHLIGEHLREKQAADRAIKSVRDEVTLLQQQLTTSTAAHAAAVVVAPPLQSSPIVSAPSSYLSRNVVGGGGARGANSGGGTGRDTPHSHDHPPSSSQMQRLERELVKVNLQLSEAQSSSSHHAEQVDRLSSQNDELMIMYGEKVEELLALEEKLLVANERTTGSNVLVQQLEPEEVVVVKE